MLMYRYFMRCVTNPVKVSRATLLALPLLAIFTSANADIARHKVRIEGHGSLTVVFESGLGDTLEVWNNIQPLIAESCARTIAYTRAGYPGSDAASGPRDSATIVAELRAELKRRGILPPYVLVGHSLGGLYMQYFARHYPAEIRGLLLVDSTHWNQQLRLSPDKADAFGRRSTVLFMPWIMRRELLDSVSAGEQVHISPVASVVPTIVLSRTRALNGETQALQVQAETLQGEIAADFPSARHIRVTDSGHYIQRDRPEVVIEAARELAGCRPLEQVPN
ncbi:MAG TPA: alpha/beta fold hydrolase [Steroidobacteraceae bacterium]|nr:alpha/beta fold hydrolase [Steroidobacteraceae bacterium]